MTKLKALMHVFQRLITPQEAADTLGISVRAVTSVIKQRGDDLPALYTALTQLQEGRITLEEAATRLNISKKTIHSLRKRYGTAPKRTKLPQKPVKKQLTEPEIRQFVLEILQGKYGIRQAATCLNASTRTISRHLARETGYQPRLLALLSPQNRAEIAKKLQKRYEKHGK